MLRTILSTSVCLFVATSLSFAQQTTTSTDPELERYKAETERIAAETARKTAETAKTKAEQDAAKQSAQSELDRLKAEKDLLDVQNATATAKRKDDIDRLKAQKDLIDASALKVEGAPQGTVTFDNQGAASIENTVMAYESFTGLAPTIADAIVLGREKSTFVIIGAADRAALTALPVFESQADMLIKRLTAVNNLKDNAALQYPEADSEPSFALADLGTAGAFINAAAGLVSLFRVDDRFVIKDEPPDVRAIYSVVAKEIRTRAGKVYYPEAMTPGLFGDVSASSVHKKLSDVLAALDVLWTTHFLRMAESDRATKEAAEKSAVIDKSAKASKDIAALKLERGRATTTAARKKEIDTLIAEREELVMDASALTAARVDVAALLAFLDANTKYLALLDRVLESGDGYVTAMTTAEAGASAPVSALIGAERLRTLYKTALNSTYAIEIGVVRLAGTRREHRNFFGTSVRFSGGVVASYRVFQAATGELVASDTVSRVSPLKKLEQ